MEIRPEGTGAWRVRVVQGDAVTSHRVAVSEDELAQLGLSGADPESVVRASFEFLLEREPATSILSDFSLDVIPRYFPEYATEMARIIGR